MRQIVFIIILSLFSAQKGIAQNQVVNKLIILQKPRISLSNTGSFLSLYQTLPKPEYKAEAVDFSLLHLNDQPVLKFTKAPGKPVKLFTEFSFSDVLENSMNGLKVNLVNTYDDFVPELFSDAPSLFKVKCIIPL
jgi:hypothetical protein